MTNDKPKSAAQVLRELNKTGTVIGNIGALKVVISADVPKGEIHINSESVGMLFAVSEV